MPGPAALADPTRTLIRLNTVAKLVRESYIAEIHGDAYDPIEVAVTEHGHAELRLRPDVVAEVRHVHDLQQTLGRAASP